MRRSDKLKHTSSSQKNILNKRSIANQSSPKSISPPQTKKLTHDQNLVSFRGGIKRSFHVLVHPHKTVNLDLEYQRSVHLKFQRPTHQIFIFSGQQLHQNLIPTQKYRNGPELWSQIFSRSQLLI